MAPNDNELHNKLGRLEAMAEQGVAEREKIFEKLDSINEKINAIATTRSEIAVADAKADKAHERVDKLIEHLDNVKGKALVILGSAALGTAGASHAIEPVIRKFFGG